MRTRWLPSLIVVPLLLLACSGEDMEPSEGEGGQGGGAGSGPSAPRGAAGVTGGTAPQAGAAPTVAGSAPIAGSYTAGTGSNASGSAGIAGSAASGGGAAGAGGAASGGAGQGGTNAGASGAAGRGGGVGGASGGASGKSGSGGSSAGAAGSPAGGSGGAVSGCATWPTAKGSQNVSATINVSGTYDGQFKRFVGSGDLGTAGQDEDQGPLFKLAAGATLKNVIIGTPAADGVHCDGACTLENVWWEDVGEDAATFRGSSSSQRMTVRCGGAKMAADKVFQHNGAGTLTIQNFQVDGFGKLYRSCGNCSTQYERHVVLQDITARSGTGLVGINTNYGDSAEFERITVYGSIPICQRWTGNDTGAEPTMTGTGPDPEFCLYAASDITQH